MRAGDAEAASVLVMHRSPGRQGVGVGGAVVARGRVGGLATVAVLDRLPVAPAAMVAVTV